MVLPALPGGAFWRVRVNENHPKLCFLWFICQDDCISIENIILWVPVPKSVGYFFSTPQRKEIRKKPSANSVALAKRAVNNYRLGCRSKKSVNVGLFLRQILRRLWVCVWINSFFFQQLQTRNLPNTCHRFHSDVGLVLVLTRMNVSPVAQITHGGPLRTK